MPSPRQCRVWLKRLAPRSRRGLLARGLFFRCALLSGAWHLGPRVQGQPWYVVLPAAVLGSLLSLAALLLSPLKERVAQLTNGG